MVNINTIFVFLAFMFIANQAVSNEFDIENCPFNEKKIISMNLREIQRYARKGCENERSDAAKALFIRVSQEEMKASDLLDQLSGSTCLGEARTAYLCLRSMVRYNRTWAEKNLAKFLVKYMASQLGTTKEIKKDRLSKLWQSVFGKRKKIDDSIPAAPLTTLGVGAQLLINYKVGANCDKAECFIKDFLIGLCESKNESDHHIAAQVIAEHCYTELDTVYHKSKNYHGELVRWPGQHLVDLFESGEPGKQFICYSVLKKAAKDLDDLTSQYKKPIKDILEPLLAKPKDENFAALLVTTYLINQPERSSVNVILKRKSQNKVYLSLKETDDIMDGFSLDFQKKIGNLKSRVDSIKEKYQPFPSLPVPYMSTVP